MPFHSLSQITYSIILVYPGYLVLIKYLKIMLCLDKIGGLCFLFPFMNLETLKTPFWGEVLNDGFRLSCFVLWFFFLTVYCYNSLCVYL